MEYYSSIRPIKHQYSTGEEPVLVDCSDQKTRVCKYTRSSGSAYKLVCELVGAKLSVGWLLGCPKVDFVSVKRAHVPDNVSPHYFSLPCIGSEFLQGVVDITPTSCHRVPATDDMLIQLLKIALFDFWMANEDRNANNANLMYDIQNERLVPIDNGCILNTATFEYPLSQLTSTDSILSADIFAHLTQSKSQDEVMSLLPMLQAYFFESLERSRKMVEEIIADIPEQWRIPLSIIQTKLDELFTESWTTAIWENFIECLNENLNHE